MQFYKANLTFLDFLKVDKVKVVYPNEVKVDAAILTEPNLTTVGLLLLDISYGIGNVRHDMTSSF